MVQKAASPTQSVAVTARVTAHAVKKACKLLEAAEALCSALAAAGLGVLLSPNDVVRVDHADFGRRARKACGTPALDGFPGGGGGGGGIPAPGGTPHPAAGGRYGASRARVRWSARRPPLGSRTARSAAAPERPARFSTGGACGGTVTAKVR